MLAHILCKIHPASLSIMLGPEHNSNIMIRFRSDAQKHNAQIFEHNLGTDH